MQGAKLPVAAGAPLQVPLLVWLHFLCGITTIRSTLQHGGDMASATTFKHDDGFHSAIRLIIGRAWPAPLGYLTRTPWAGRPRRGGAMPNQYLASQLPISQQSFLSPFPTPPLSVGGLHLSR